jgi:hypothetical protein
MNNNLEELKQQMFDDILFRLGGNIIDLEVDPEHLEAAYKYAIRMYRQRSSNSVQESYTQLVTQKNVDTYTLPNEFVHIRGLIKRSFGGISSGSGTNFDPFSQAAANTYLLNQSGGSGSLATYEM